MSTGSPESPDVFKIIVDPKTAYKNENILLIAGLLGPTVRSKIVGLEGRKVFYHWSIDTGPKDFDLTPTNDDLKANNDQKIVLATEELPSGSYTIQVQASSRPSPDIPAGTDPMAEASFNIERSIEIQVYEKIIRSGLPLETKTSEPTSGRGLWAKLRRCLNGDEVSKSTKRF